MGGQRNHYRQAIPVCCPIIPIGYSMSTNERDYAMSKTFLTIAAVATLITGTTITLAPAHAADAAMSEDSSDGKMMMKKEDGKMMKKDTMMKKDGMMKDEKMSDDKMMKKDDMTK
jgi:hypothetical protein